jgi:hypothetical protein
VSADKERDRLLAIAQRMKRERDQAMRRVGELEVQRRASAVLLDFLWRLVGSDSAKS